MGVDLNKTKSRQAEEEQKAAARQSGGFRFWTPKPGKNRIRLLPPWTTSGPNADQFEREVYMHWNVGPEGKGTFLCPRKTPNLENNTGQCPICDEVDRLRGTGDPADDEIANNIRAQQKFYSNIVDLDDAVYTQKDMDEWTANPSNKDRDCSFAVGDTKIGVFTYGPMIYKQLIDLFAELNKDLTDVQGGHDLIVKREGQGKNGTKYNVILDPQVKPLIFVGQKSLQERMPNLDVINAPKKVEEMRAAINGSAPLPTKEVEAGPAPATMPKALPTAAPAQQAAPPKAATPPKAAPAPKPAPAPVAAAADEDRPECFSDTEVWSDTDPECVGGVKGADEYDPCPHYQACGQSIGKLVAPEAVAAKSSRRRGVKAAAPVPSNGAGSDADMLEQQMAEALR